METVIRQDCTQLKGHFKEVAFFDCVFRDLRGLTLQNCDLNKSKFTTDSIKEAQGFTITLDCLSFANVELSELIFDLILMLLLKSSGNDNKRQQLLDVIGQDRALALLKATRYLERNKE